VFGPAGFSNGLRRFLSFFLAIAPFLDTQDSFFYCLVACFPSFFPFFSTLSLDLFSHFDPIWPWMGGGGIDLPFRIPLFFSWFWFGDHAPLFAISGVSPPFWPTIRGMLF